MSQQYTIFAIRDKTTGHFAVYGSKCAWVSAGAAKNAFALHNYEYKMVPCKYPPSGLRQDCVHIKLEEQNQYELIELRSDLV